MEYVWCCLCSMLCFVCGGWAARGMSIPPRKKKQAERQEMEYGTDALSRDIAALLAYTIPRKEESDDESEADK